MSITPKPFYVYIVGARDGQISVRYLAEKVCFLLKSPANLNKKSFLGCLEGTLDIASIDFFKGYC